MRKLFLILFALPIILTGCKSKEMTRPAPERTPVEHHREATEVARPELDNIPTLEERFTFEKTEDKADHDPNEFFVIMGSFRSNENAHGFKNTLTNKGFKPVILLSETGFHRVCVDSYTDETEARMRVHDIRTNFPEYDDTWLLIRKE